MYSQRRRAGGVTSGVAAQHREIDQLNAKNRERFRLLKGIEANIRADGSVDMSLSELAQLEIVVAAPHSALRSPLARLLDWAERRSRAA